MSECKHLDWYFDRSICPEPCGDMHYYCEDCGELDGYCPLQTEEFKEAERFDEIDRLSSFIHEGLTAIQGECAETDDSVLCYDLAVKMAEDGYFG